MITLKQAIKVLRLQDHILVWLLEDERMSTILAPCMSVKQIKEKFDLTKVYVTYIAEERALYDGEFYGYKFVIKKENKSNVKMAH